MRYTGAVLVTVLIVEIAAAVAVAHAISWPFTLLLLVVVSLVGAELLRREGWAAFRSRRRRRDQSPERQLGNVAAGVLAAGLVAVPGFVTAAIGLVGLTPPGRAVVRRALAHRFAAQIVTVGGWQRRSRTADDPRVVDSTLADPTEGPIDLTKDHRTL